MEQRDVNKSPDPPLHFPNELSVGFFQVCVIEFFNQMSIFCLSIPNTNLELSILEGNFLKGSKNLFNFKTDQIYCEKECTKSLMSIFSGRACFYVLA